MLIQVILTNSYILECESKVLQHSIAVTLNELSGCVLFFDNLDAVDQLPTRQEREQWLKQLVIEMDGLDDHPPMAVIATTKHTYQLDQALLHPGRFEHQVVMSNSIMTHPVSQT